MGVGGAKDFFEAKVRQIRLVISEKTYFSQIADIRRGSKFEDEIREEQEERKRLEEEKRIRQNLFKETAALFGGAA